MKKLIINAAISLMGGVSGIIELALEWFNTKVLSKIQDKEEAAAYCEDVSEFSTFLEGVLGRHEKWLSDARRAALQATIESVKELAEALKDVNIDKDELDRIIAKVKAAIDAWIASK